MKACLFHKQSGVRDAFIFLEVRARCPVCRSPSSLEKGGWQARVAKCCGKCEACGPLPAGSPAGPPTMLEVEVLFLPRVCVSFLPSQPASRPAYAMAGVDGMKCHVQKNGIPAWENKTGMQVAGFMESVGKQSMV